ncbi:sorbitol dehydrogenase family protein [Rouxiella chamberiensis]|uniref:Sorbitol dehydrogenase family protein n=1 Tax=Rouxiella chamberiensis TaxID=1513468 RepID=A0ABY7HRR3_9GAMM|nr:sorbitol dehydrogenase family protein [Rouxiella chamberiensis]WAT01692.1 sorbitol dehydrogenase family protein [Rouxiella chamberiensis]
MDNNRSLFNENIRENGTGFSRRDMLKGVGSAMVAATLLGFPFLTQAEKDTATGDPVIFTQFFQVSKAITEHQDLSPGMSARIFNAFYQGSPQFPAQVSKLFALLKPGLRAKDFQNAARQNELGDILTAIITGWYTGTVKNGTDTILIAYKDALMYRPVSDGLIVPTYCGNGPLWFTAPPPAAPMPDSMKEERLKATPDSVKTSKA